MAIPTPEEAAGQERGERLRIALHHSALELERIRKQRDALESQLKRSAAGGKAAAALGWACFGVAMILWGLQVREFCRVAIGIVALLSVGAALIISKGEREEQG